MRGMETPHDIDRAFFWPLGKAERLARRGKLPHFLLPDGSIRFRLDELKALVRHVEPHADSAAVKGESAMPDLHLSLSAALQAIDEAQHRDRDRRAKLRDMQALADTRKQSLAELEAQHLRERARAEFEGKEEVPAGRRDGHLEAERRKSEQTAALIPAMEQESRDALARDLAACFQHAAGAASLVQAFLDGRREELGARIREAMTELVGLYGVGRVEDSLRGAGIVRDFFQMPTGGAGLFDPLQELLRLIRERSGGLVELRGHVLRVQAALGLPAQPVPTAPVEGERNV